MHTWHIHIEGQVQGVGFRPFVWRCAKVFNLSGSVANTSNGVHIYVNTLEDELAQFLEKLVSEAPPRAFIRGISHQKISLQLFTGFTILDSQTDEAPNLFISPDFGICSTCKDECLATHNRRYHYPFITCTDCGPRFSIINGLPYDRKETSMASFTMCDTCQSEFNNPEERRYFSQTNSCIQCGIQLKSIYPDERLIAWKEIARQIKIGLIVAIKGSGGYLLLCRASNEEVVKELRVRKQRPRKPFALLVGSVEQAEDYVEISEREAAALSTADRPIVLCKAKNKGLGLKGIAPDLDMLGIMLPFDGLTWLISHELGEPLVATSANLHQSPIIAEDHEAKSSLQEIADLIVSHNRDITFAQDDSVVRFSSLYQQRILLRRSKGMAPSFWEGSLLFEEDVLAMGSDLKAVFSIANKGKMYVSPFLGNLASWESQTRYQLTLQRMLSLLTCKPKVRLVDAHPAYFSRQMKVESLTACNTFEIQHHKAHMASCLLEHQLLDFSQPLLGVIWDGLGWGDDGALWGGEWIKFEDGVFSRLGHIGYFDYFMGDKMSKEPRLSAFSLLYKLSEDLDLIKPHFSEKEWSYYTKAIQREPGKKSSSMGRLFDAVSAILGVCIFNSYEGEAAMLLEVFARRYADQINWDKLSPFNYSIDQNGKVDIWVMLQDLINSLKKGQSKEQIAFRFHMTLVDIVMRMAEKAQIQHLVFSGGVFQNGLLLDFMLHKLEPMGLKLFFHEQLSPNDENIAAGQLAVYYIDRNYKTSKKQKYVLSNTG